MGRYKNLYLFSVVWRRCLLYCPSRTIQAD